MSRHGVFLFSQTRLVVNHGFHWSVGAWPLRSCISPVVVYAENLEGARNFSRSFETQEGRPPCLIFFTSSTSQHVDIALIHLAEMAGVDTVAVDPSELRSLDEIRSRIGRVGHLCLAVSAATLADLLNRSGADLDDFIAEFSSALVYGFDGAPATNQMLFRLSGGTLAGAGPTPHRELEFSFPCDLPEECRQLRNSSLRIEGNLEDWRTFQGDHKRTLIAADRAPFLVDLGRDSGHLFALAGDQLLDVDLPATPSALTADAYMRIIPWMMFLRIAFGDACWHNPRPRGTWIIDDPWLRQRYGFLDYSDLLRAMDADDFTAGVAFIPWNWARNHPGTVEMFKSRRDRLSLCVHGCDHTDGEFKRGAEAELRTKARLAQKRMHQLRARTGLSYDSVMVFPQGGFCKAAIRSLDGEGFAAALNTSVFPSDAGRNDLTVRDLLAPAITRYGRCPLFSRKYPTGVFPVAFDLFMGRPALLVEHHSYFRHGYEPMAAFSRWLKAQEPALKWSSLGEIVSKAALYRRVAPGETSVRFYTDHFVLRNHDERRTAYRLHRNGNFQKATHVICNGRPVDAKFSDSMLTTQVTLEPGQIARIELPPAPPPAHREASFPAAYRVKVAARRYLSEFRDNYIARNELLLAAAQGLKKRMSAGTPRASAAE